MCGGFVAAFPIVSFVFPHRFGVVTMTLVCCVWVCFYKKGGVYEMSRVQYFCERKQSDFSELGIEM